VQLQQMMWGVMAGLAVVTAGCGSDNVLGPANQLEVTNTTDDFQLQATALDNVSQTLIYQWEMTGAQANVNQSGSVTAGSATLRIMDGAGVEVYNGDLADTGTFQTMAGASAGTWSIRLALSGASGAINFRVQKP
jgi:hypothetical protein